LRRTDETRSDCGGAGGGRALGQLVAARRKGENGKGGTSRQVILPNPTTQFPAATTWAEPAWAVITNLKCLMGLECRPSPIRPMSMASLSAEAMGNRPIPLDKPLSQPISHGGEKRGRRQGRGGEDDVAAGVCVLHGPAHRSREGLFSLPPPISRLLLTRLVIGNGWWERRRRRRYRRSRRRAPRAWRGGAASSPTSSAPTPRLVLQFCTSVAACCLCCLVSFGMLQFSDNLLMGFDLLMLVGA
jgi:hypothetical protein